MRGGTLEAGGYGDFEALVEIHTEDCEVGNVVADEEGHAALEWNTSGNANSVSYDGVSLLEIEGGRDRRFRACFDPRTISEKVED